MIFTLTQIKLIFTTKVSLLASFSKWEFWTPKWPISLVARCQTQPLRHFPSVQAFLFVGRAHLFDLRKKIQLFYVLDWFLDTGSSNRKKPDFWLHVCVVVSYTQKPFKLLAARPCSPPSRQIKANPIARPIQQIRISNWLELFSSNCKKAQERIWSGFRRRNIVHVEPIF